VSREQSCRTNLEFGTIDSPILVVFPSNEIKSAPGMTMFDGMEVMPIHESASMCPEGDWSVQTRPTGVYDKDKSKGTENAPVPELQGAKDRSTYDPASMFKDMVYPPDTIYDTVTFNSDRHHLTETAPQSDIEQVNVSNMFKTYVSKHDCQIEDTGYKEQSVAVDNMHVMQATANGEKDMTSTSNVSSVKKLNQLFCHRKSNNSGDDLPQSITQQDLVVLPQYCQQNVYCNPMLNTVIIAAALDITFSPFGPEVFIPNRKMWDVLNIPLKVINQYPSSSCFINLTSISHCHVIQYSMSEFLLDVGCNNVHVSDVINNCTTHPQIIHKFQPTTIAMDSPSTTYIPVTEFELKKGPLLPVTLCQRVLASYVFDDQIADTGYKETNLSVTLTRMRSLPVSGMSQTTTSAQVSSVTDRSVTISLNSDDSFTDPDVPTSAKFSRAGNILLNSYDYSADVSPPHQNHCLCGSDSIITIPDAQQPTPIDRSIAQPVVVRSISDTGLILQEDEVQRRRTAIDSSTVAMVFIVAMVTAIIISFAFRFVDNQFITWNCSRYTWGSQSLPSQVRRRNDAHWSCLHGEVYPLRDGPPLALAPSPLPDQHFASKASSKKIRSKLPDILLVPTARMCLVGIQDITHSHCPHTSTYDNNRVFFGGQGQVQDQAFPSPGRPVRVQASVNRPIGHDRAYA
jgi:hypothetical protein